MTSNRAFSPELYRSSPPERNPIVLPPKRMGAENFSAASPRSSTLYQAREHCVSKGKREKNKGKLIPHTPEADNVVMLGRLVPDTVRRAREPGNTVPGTAAQRVAIAMRRTRGVR